MGFEQDKREVLLSTNTFNKPAELSGVAAWSQLVLNLLYLNPGQFPSMPMLGIGIRNYEFEFFEEVVSELAGRIKTQVATYLSGVPLVDVTCTKEMSIGDNPKPVLIIVLTFDNNGNYESSAIAASVEGNKLLDFDVSWE